MMRIKIVIALIVAVVAVAMFGLLQYRSRQSTALISEKARIRQSGDTGRSKDRAGLSDADARSSMRDRRGATGPGMDTTAPDGKTSDGPKNVVDLASLFLNEKDPVIRGELAMKIADTGDAQAIDKLLELLKAEQDPDVRLEILRALSWADARGDKIELILAELGPLYKTTDNTPERVAIQNVFGETESLKSVDFLKTAYGDKKADPEERLNAAENMLKIRITNNSIVSSKDAKELVDKIKTDAMAFEDPRLRAQAYMAISLSGPESREILQQLRANEKDEGNIKLLDNLIKMGASMKLSAGSGSGS